MNDIDLFWQSSISKWKKNAIAFLLVALSCISLFYIGFGFISARQYGMQNGWTEKIGSLSNAEWSVSDYEPVWQGNAYTLKGISPKDILEGRIEADPEIGKIIPGTANVPWTYILSNLFIPGFLPFHSAIYFSIAWWFILWVIALTCAWKRLFPLCRKDRIFCALLLTLLTSQISLSASLNTMNPNTWVYPLLLIVCMGDSQKYAVPIGICLGLAMIKPQLSALFLFPFLVKKEFKVLISAGLTVLAGLLLFSLATHEPPVQSVLSYMALGTESLSSQSGYVRDLFASSQGIFYAFSDHYVQDGNLLHWIVFVPVCLLLCLLCRQAPAPILFSIPLTISCLWMYNLPLNRNMGLLLIALFLLLHQKERSNAFTLISYLFAALLLLPISSGTFCRLIGSFKPIPISALIYFVCLLWVILCYRRDSTKNPKQRTEKPLVDRNKNEIGSPA